MNRTAFREKYPVGTFVKFLGGIARVGYYQGDKIFVFDVDDGGSEKGSFSLNDMYHPDVFRSETEARQYIENRAAEALEKFRRQ